MCMLFLFLAEFISINNEVLTTKCGFYTLRICRISCRLRERFGLPNAFVTGMYEIPHTAEGTEGWQTLGVKGFLGFGYC